MQAALKTPIAAGEDAIDAEALFGIAKAVGVLRVDATTCGGVAQAVTVIQAAGLQGCDVLPHVHHHLHAQLAGALPEIRFLEIIPEETGADPAHLLMQRRPRVDDGLVVLDEEPGAGLALYWDAVERFCVASAAG